MTELKDMRVEEIVAQEKNYQEGETMIYSVRCKKCGYPLEFIRVDQQWKCPKCGLHYNIIVEARPA